MRKLRLKHLGMLGAIAAVATFSTVALTTTTSMAASNPMIDKAVPDVAISMIGQTQTRFVLTQADDGDTTHLRVTTMDMNDPGIYYGHVPQIATPQADDILTAFKFGLDDAGTTKIFGADGFIHAAASGFDLKAMTHAILLGADDGITRKLHGAFQVGYNLPADDYHLGKPTVTFDTDEQLTAAATYESGLDNNDQARTVAQLMQIAHVLTDADGRTLDHGLIAGARTIS